MNYYIEGNPDKASQIKAAFEKLGYDTSFVQNLFASDNHILFTLPCDSRVHAFHTAYIEADILKRLVDIDPDYKELELPIEPCFKVGDKIEATIYGIKRRVTIREVDKTNRCYFGTLEECIGFSEQDQWHLAPKPHYDISNFKPFDNVLTRHRDGCNWECNLFSRYDHRLQNPFITCNSSYPQCIPFNDDTKHLLGTTDMCDEQYVNW